MHENSMIGLTLIRGVISPRESKLFGGGIATRAGDPTGTYNFEIYVRNGFPSEIGDNWRALADPETTFATVNP